MRSALLLVALVALASCTAGADSGTTVTLGAGADTPTAAVEQLRDALAAGDFDAAGALVVPEQAILASLAEGASPSLIATSLEEGDDQVAANFWSGFAQGVGEAFTGEMTIEDAGSVTESGVEFFLVGVTPEGGTERIMVTRDLDGQHLDIFASFGAALAEGMISPVELLLGSSSPDSRAVLGTLQDVVPSLLVSATDPGLTPQTVQRILQLVELITRAG